MQNDYKKCACQGIKYLQPSFLLKHAESNTYVSVADRIHEWVNSVSLYPRVGKQRLIDSEKKHPRIEAEGGTRKWKQAWQRQMPACLPSLF